MRTGCGSGHDPEIGTLSRQCDHSSAFRSSNCCDWWCTGLRGDGAAQSLPFSDSAPDFPDYLRGERGLRWLSVEGYAGDLRALESYLPKTGHGNLSQLTPRG